MITLTNNKELLNKSNIVLEFNNNIEYGLLNFDKHGDKIIITFGLDFNKEFEVMLQSKFSEILDFVISSGSALGVDLNNNKNNLFLTIDSISNIVDYCGFNKDIVIYSSKLTDFTINANFEVIENVNQSFESEFDEYYKKYGKEIIFRDYLFSLIVDNNIDYVSLYKRAQISKSTASRLLDFSKPPSNPSKETLLALGMALKYNEEEMENFLNHAGYSLRKNTYIDVVVKYFINNRIYDVYALNAFLCSNNMNPLVGSKKNSNVIVK